MSVSFLEKNVGNNCTVPREDPKDAEVYYNTATPFNNDEFTEGTRDTDTDSLESVQFLFKELQTEYATGFDTDDYYRPISDISPEPILCRATMINNCTQDPTTCPRGRPSLWSRARRVMGRGMENLRRCCCF